jgi:penicillin amidase
MRRTPQLSASLLALAVSAGCGDTTSPVDAGRDAVGDAPRDASVPAQTVRLAGLAGPVSVTFDAHGWAHIKGASVTDVVRVEGYLQARDRMFQMELFRRNASGTLAELAGAILPTLVDSDINARVIGYRRTAQAIWDGTMPGEEREILTAFSEGVTAYIRELRTGAASLPSGSEFLQVQRIGDWTPVDTLTVIRLQHGVQSLDLSDVGRTNVVRLVRERFGGADPMTAAQRYGRRGIVGDIYRFAPVTESTSVPRTTTMARARRPRPLRVPRPARPEAAVTPALVATAERFRESIESRHAMLATRSDRGSNEWGIAASATRDRKAILASDPHVTLPSPSLFWGTHLTVTGAQPIDVAGSIIPGVPGVLIGFTSRVAWALTNANYDQTDVFAVTVTPGTNGAPGTVQRNGQPVTIERVTERIQNDVGATTEVTLERVPGLGFIIPTIQGGRVVPRTDPTALVLRWTGNDPSHELQAIFGMIRAQDARGARDALSAWGGPSLNWTIVDSGGNVAYSTQSSVPIRMPGARTWNPMTNPTGTLPCFVLPGDGTADWMGSIPAAMLPQGETSAERPFIANANNDQAGYNLDNNPLNDPVFLTCFHDPGFRQQRILTRLGEVSGRATPDDMEAIQGDHRVEFGGRLRPFLAAAMTALAEERTRPGSHPDLTAVASATSARAPRLEDAARRIAMWSLQSPAGVEHEGSEAERTDSIATTLFHLWAYKAVELTFADEGRALGAGVGGLIPLLWILEHPMEAATHNPATGQSVLFDNLDTEMVNESRDAVLVTALDQALTEFERTAGGADFNTWTWGRFHTVTFSTLLTGLGAAQTIPGMSEPTYAGRGYPRHGGFYVVDASFPRSFTNLSYAAGPGHRLVVEMDPAGPRARIALPGGQSIDPDSAFQRDGAALWRVNRSHPIPFRETDVQAAATSRATFMP